MPKNSLGIAHLFVLLFVAAVGLISFLIISSGATFKDKLFSGLFPKNLPKAAGTTDTSYNLGVLVLKYFPLTSDGQNIDISVTGDVGGLYTQVRQSTIDITAHLQTSLQKGASYLGYKDATALPALNYSIVDTKEYTQAVPTIVYQGRLRYPDYNGIMTAHNICDYVDNKNVREVWMFAYQGPNKPDGHAYLEIFESKMSGPYGDISNSYRYNDMPVCKNTYRVYTFNYGRGTAEAMESWGHQMEAELSEVNTYLFRNLWQGQNYPQTLNISGRCGSVHNPPNARYEYDRGNSTPQKSDCLDWNAVSLGALSDISCLNWGCADVSDSNNAGLNYQVWNWQNMPGRNNTKTYQGMPLRNWWDIHGDFDNVMATTKTLTIPGVTPAPSATPSSQIVVSDSFNRIDNPAGLGNTETGQIWETVRGSFGITANAAYPVDGCPAPGYAVVDSGVSDGIIEVTIPVNRQDLRIPFRMVDVNNYYWIENRGFYYDVNKMVGGVGSNVSGSGGANPANGDKLRVELNGPNIKMFDNGLPIASAIDSSLKGTKHGIGTWCNGFVRFDDFKVSKYLPLPTPTPTPTPSSKQGDINGDNGINIVDLSILLSKWNSADTSADINKDGKVNIIDLSVLLSNWGK